MTSMVAAPPSVLFFGPLAPVSVSGADAALSACGDGCIAYLQVGQDMITYYWSSTADPAVFQPALQAFVASLAAA
jgi:hypothetical protein